MFYLLSRQEIKCRHKAYSERENYGDRNTLVVYALKLFMKKNYDEYIRFESLFAWK